MMEESFDEDFSLKKDSLAIRLQQRRPREVLAEQGIIPPLNSPGTYFPQVQRLERARKEDYLNHAIQGRPERDVLVQKHILEDTSAAGCIVANQKDLKKAKLVDDLNDKLASRPGVFELVERNIIPANKNVQDAIKGGYCHYQNGPDYNEEDSNEALSPEQLTSLTASPPLFPLSSAPTMPHSSIQSPTAYTNHNDHSVLTRSSSSQSLFTQTSSHPYLSRQISKGSKMGQSSLMPRMYTRKKKDKQLKFKKFKYHQYVPPDQQHGKLEEKKASSAIEDDSPYTRLLQQQQVYLQLQIMNNQYSNQRNGDSQATGTFNHHRDVLSPPPNSPLTQTMKMEKMRNPNTPLTESKLDEMKVSELKEELKQRGQKVTGTKEILVERLRPYCLSSENSFLTNLSRSENGTLNFSLNPSMLTESNNGRVGQIPLSATSSNTPTPQTAFAIDPNIVHRHKVARMPAPERHRVVLKREKLTMPTWHHAGESLGTQTLSSPSPSVSNYMPVEKSRDMILEEQQKEIDNLKRMVEMQRQQLHGKQLTKDVIQPQVMRKPLHTAKVSRPVFQFPTAQHTDPRQSRSSVGSLSSAQTPHKDMDPPNYEQAYEMLSVSKASSHPPCNQSNHGMDNMMMSANTTNPMRAPRSSVTRVLLNDHESYYGLNGVSTNIAQKSYPQQQHTDYAHQDQAQMQRESRQNHINKMTNIDFAEKDRLPDLTKMLVESAGDALMDTSNFPPVIYRYSNASLDQYPTEHSRVSARNSVDSEVVYSHFSPMDTNHIDVGNRDLNHLRLSTSSLDSGEPTLNALSQSNNVYPSNRHYSSPKPTNLLKSTSQELLASCSPSSNNPMNSNLNWLDLNLVSAAATPPSPGSLFDPMNLDEQALQQNSYPVSTHGSRDGDLNLCFAPSAANLDYPPSSNGLSSHWDNNWDGLLGNYNL